MSAEKSVIVVGNDGSKAARPALAWALRHAAAVGGRVRVVRGWTMASAPRPATQTLGYIPPIEDFEAAVIEDLKNDTAAVVAEHADVEVEYVAARGPAANGLLAASTTADLLVVGARGLGGFRGLALGSVSDQVTRHSACPVVIVRSEHSADTERTLPRD